MSFDPSCERCSVFVGILVKIAGKLWITNYVICLFFIQTFLMDLNKNNISFFNQLYNWEIGYHPPILNMEPDNGIGRSLSYWIRPCLGFNYSYKIATCYDQPCNKQPVYFFQIDILVNKCHVDSTGKATMGTHGSSDHPTLPSGFHVGKTMP